MEELFELVNRLPRRAGIIFAVVAIALFWWIGSKVGHTFGWIKEDPPEAVDADGNKVPRRRIPLR